jgi:hypothetical protein
VIGYGERSLRICLDKPTLSGPKFALQRLALGQTALQQRIIAGLTENRMGDLK